MGYWSRLLRKSGLSGLCNYTKTVRTLLLITRTIARMMLKATPRRQRSAFLHFRKMVLTPAFGELRRRGIFASNQHLECCNRCAVGACSRATGGSFVYYSAQDKDMYDGGSIYLGHHLDTPEDRATALRVLGQYGDVEWDGDAATKILLHDGHRAAQNPAALLAAPHEPASGHPSRGGARV